MSVIVKGMEMPKKAMFAAILPPDDEHGTWYISVVEGKGKKADYEIIPLPEKHGDLIDISEKVNIEYYDDMNEEWSLMEGTVEIALFRCCEDFPKVIIEAEGE